MSFDICWFLLSYATFLVNALISGINWLDLRLAIRDIEKKPIKRIIDIAYVALNQQNTL